MWRIYKKQTSCFQRHGGVLYSGYFNGPRVQYVASPGCYGFFCADRFGHSTVQCMCVFGLLHSQAGQCCIPTNTTCANDPVIFCRPSVQLVYSFDLSFARCSGQVASPLPERHRMPTPERHRMPTPCTEPGPKLSFSASLIRSLTV